MLRKVEERRRWISNRLIQYVDIVFGVVVGQAIIRNIDYMRTPWSHPFGLYALIIVIVTVTLSWIGYHKSMFEFPYKAEILSPSRILRPFTDFVIVVLYTILLFTIDGFRQNPTTIDLSVFVLCYVWIFYFYLVDGLIRRVEHNDPDATQSRLIVEAFSVCFLLFLAYPIYLSYDYRFTTAVNYAVLSVCFLVMLLYRYKREPRYGVTILSEANKKRDLSIVVDVDGVLADQVTPVLDRLNKEFGSNYVKDDILLWDQPLPLAKTDIKVEIENSHNDPVFVLDMKPIQFAQQVMKELSKYCFITIATNRTGLADKATQDWLKKYKIPYNVYSNTSIQGKGAIVGDLIIDDYPKNILAFIATDKDRKGIVFSQPWNLTEPTLLGKDNIYRAKDWREVFSIIDSFEWKPF